MPTFGAIAFTDFQRPHPAVDGVPEAGGAKKSPYNFRCEYLRKAGRATHSSRRKTPETRNHDSVPKPALYYPIGLSRSYNENGFSLSR
jgi:hypothetical protein